jgi:hypothetical protein
MPRETEELPAAVAGERFAAAWAIASRAVGSEHWIMRGDESSCRSGDDGEAVAIGGGSERAGVVK